MYLANPRKLFICVFILSIYTSYTPSDLEASSSLRISSVAIFKAFYQFEPIFNVTMVAIELFLIC